MVGLFLLGFIASWYFSAGIGLALHELSHAFVGRLLGFRIREIVVGQGRDLLRLRLFETTLRVRTRWRTGFVMPFPSFTAKKWTELAFVAAGPAMNVLLLVLLLWASLLSAVPRDAFPFFAVAASAQFVLIANNILPRFVMIDGKPHETDGLAILNILRGRRNFSRDAREFYFNKLMFYWDGQGPPPRISTYSPWIAHCMWGAPSGPEAAFGKAEIESLERRIAQGLHSAEETLILDRLATWALCTGGEQAVAQLDAWTSRAQRLNPGLGTLKGSRGAALVQLGRYDEALAMLAEADYSNLFDATLNRLFMAQAAFRQGDQPMARVHFAEALAALVSSGSTREGPAWPVMARIAGEIGHPIEE